MGTAEQVLAAVDAAWTALVVAAKDEDDADCTRGACPASLRAWALLQRACAFARHLPDELAVAGVVVVGSVARGDFHDHSDIDVVVIAGHLPDRPADRLAALGPPPPGAEPVVWTPDECHPAGGDEAQLAPPVRNPPHVRLRPVARCGHGARCPAGSGSPAPAR